MSLRPDGRAGLQRSLERRDNVRYEGGLEGSFSLAGGRPDGGARVFACRITSLSANGMVVTAPVNTHTGENVLIEITGYGLVRCEVQALRDDGFVCSVLLADSQRSKLATWVNWLRRHAGRIDGDKRGFIRTRPRDPRTTIALADGTVLRALITDLSRSGAALSADLVPDPGTVLMVGQVPAKVVRALEVGFAVAFERVLEAIEADTMVSGFEPAPLTSRMAS
jgi:hypothetical protein